MNYPQTILLTDDEAHIRKFIGLILRKFDNPRILEAANGAEAIELYKQHQPDLVLLDVNMPVMDGVQALTGIMAADPNAVVVMLTSLANRQTVEQCQQLGAVDYIRKDTPRDELTAR
ncbi:MAG: response regulator, partial [Oleiharenicola lentus]